MRKTKNFRPVFADKLEDRTVPSALIGPMTPFASLPGGGGSGGGGGKFGGGNLGGGGGGCVGGSSAGSTLSQDTQLVNQAFQAFDATALSAVATLRQTATSNAGPSSAGLLAYNQTISAAVDKLNSTVATDLKNLTNTGAGLASTIQGYTATLLSNVESAGTGLANSTSSAVHATDQEIQSYLRIAENSADGTILGDTATGAVTASSYRPALNAAVQAFQAAVSNAEQAVIGGGTVAAFNSAVTAAAGTLQGAISAALPAAITSSTTYNPASAISTALTTLESKLAGLTGPTVTSNASVRLFLRTVNSAVGTALSTIGQSVQTNVQNYNNSLL